MKVLRSTLLVFVILVLCAQPMQNAQSVSNIPINPTAFLPWRIQNPNVIHPPEFISVGWGHTNNQPQRNYPLVSYTEAGDTNHIRFMRPAVVYVGDCGQGNAWNCSILAADAAAGTISQMATYSFANSFKVAWVYKNRTHNSNRLNWLELNQGLENSGDGDGMVMDFNQFNSPGYDYTQLGPASIAFDEFGNLHMAVMLQFGGEYLLVYAHKINTTPTTPCNAIAGTRYQCDVIYSTSTPQAMFRQVKLVLTAGNEPRISWLNINPDSLMYAYPSPSILPRNCGPGGNTWRCISIKDSTADLDFSVTDKTPLIDMAIGPGSPQMLVQAWNSAGQARFVWAKFIGSDGNCGADFVITQTGPELVNRWYCVWNVWDPDDDTPSFDSFALKVDSLDYAIIALNRFVGGSSKVGVLYYSERRGLPPGNWYFDQVETEFWPSGLGVSMAIGTDDRLLLGYVMQELPDADLKIAIQTYKIFAPVIRK